MYNMYRWLLKSVICIRQAVAKEKRSLMGFTLIELLVVIAIIAILASVALPTYIRTIEKVRTGEAITNLQLIRAGEKIYRLEIGRYNWATIVQPPDGVNPEINPILKLDIEPEFWSYSVIGGTTTFTATATRKAGAPAGYAGDTIKINQDGWDATGTSPFQPQP